MRSVVVGGTFNAMHRGHRTLLDRAFSEGDRVFIAVTSDRFVAGHKGSALPYEVRASAVRKHVDGKDKPFIILPLEDVYGDAPTSREFQAIVVSPESLSNAERINQLRVEHDLPPLDIVKIPYVLARDFRPISSSRIDKAEIDGEGMLLRALRVGVGTTNPVKLEAVRSVFSRFYAEVELDGVQVDSGVGKEPFEDKVLEGALNRGKAALKDNDIGIGIEAGVYQGDDGLYDVQQCAIIDRMGWVTHGHGPGFRYPEVIARELRAGHSVGEACDRLFGLENNGHKGGAIGLLTNGALRRRELTEQSVLAAMVPRVRLDLYQDQA
jgi:inosine/xanthosine triphosphatase